MNETFKQKMKVGDFFLCNRRTLHYSAVYGNNCRMGKRRGKGGGRGGGGDKSVFRNPLPQCSSLETSLRGIVRGEGREGKIPSKSEGLSHPHPHTIRGGEPSKRERKGGLVSEGKGFAKFRNENYKYFPLF